MRLRLPFYRLVRSFPIVDSWTQAQYPSLRERFVVADEIINLRFEELDLRALQSQLIHRRDQLVIIVGQPLIAVLGGLLVVLGQLWVSVSVALVSAVTAYALRRERLGRPAEVYESARRRAEALRSLYFRYIADPHYLERAHAPGRSETITDGVAKLNSRGSHEPKSREGEVNRDFLNFYSDCRIGAQAAFWRFRADQYEMTHNQIEVFHERQLIAASLVGVLAAIFPMVSSVAGVIVAILGGASAALTSWGKEIGFQPYAEFFLRSEQDLRRLPHPDSNDVASVVGSRRSERILFGPEQTENDT